MVLRDHKEEIIALRETGKSYGGIAELFGVSKQRVYQILSEVCNRKDPARKFDVDIENIMYEGIYDLFANDYKMTIAKFARITFGCEVVDHAKKRTNQTVYL